VEDGKIDGYGLARVAVERPPDAARTRRMKTKLTRFFFPLDAR
jgi:hypothetical protein